MKCAVVDSEGIIANIIVADALKDKAPEGSSLIQLKENSAVDSTWTYDAEAEEFFSVRTEKPA